MADDRAKITIDSEINSDGIDKGFEDINKKISENVEKTQKEFEKVESAVEEAGKSAEEAARAVEDAAARQIAVIQSQEREKLDAVKTGEAALLAEVARATNERIALLEQEKDRLDETAYNDRLEAIRREEQAKTNEITRGSKEREALVKKDAERQVKAVKDGEKKQLEEIKKSNRSKLQEVKEFGDKASQSLSKLGSFLSTGGLSALGLGVAAAGIKQMVSTLNEWGQAALQQEMITGRLNAVLKSTGADAWVSSTQLQKMAKEQNAATGKTQDEIMEMQAVLLGFRSVTRDVFGDATQAVLDMSAVMGGGLVSTANSLGKALDSPLEGMGALSRQGFVFTEQQKELVKVLEETGRHEEAQRVILKEVQLAFDGASGATGDAAQSQIRYNNALEDLKKNIGAGWQEATAPARNWLTEIITKYNEAIEKRKELDALGKKDITTDFSAALKEDEKAAKDFINSLKIDYLEAFQSIENFAMTTEDTEERQKQIQQELLRLYRQINKEKGYELSFITEAISAYGNFIPQIKEASRQIQKERETVDALRKFEIERNEFIKNADAQAKAAMREEQDQVARIQNKREESRKALEQEIVLITRKARLEGKNIQSEEVQKQILNARVSAYTALIKEIGDAGEEEKRTFAELRAEYARLDIEAATRLQENNLKSLEQQRQAILEKAELEGRAADSLEVQKELLDAGVQAYGNQLKILRELIDGTAEEETERRRALQASWDQYRAEQMTAEAQKKRLEDLAEAQKKFISSASSLYESTIKEARDSADRRESERLSEAEKKAIEDYQKRILPLWTEAQKQKKETAINAINSAAEHEKRMAEQAAEDKLSNAKKEWEELQKNEAKQAEWVADQNRKVEEEYNRTVQKINEQAVKVQEAYTVKTGDTLSEIAQKYGTTVEAILALNEKITDRGRIKAGQVINIPVELTEEDKNALLIKAEEDKNAKLLNLEAGKNEAMEQAEQQYANARTLIYQEMENEIAAIEEAARKKTEDMDREKWENLKRNASDYLNAFSQAMNSVFSIWNSTIDAELEAKLREKDQIIQSDEEREKREKELVKEAAKMRYEAEMVQWVANILTANAQAALGVLSQMQGDPYSMVPRMVMAGILGSLQVAAVIAAKPQPPRFHEGGVAQGAAGQEIPAV
ncbi:MAG: LysM peptidoglycan-binding domain-containing protein, partial [Treponema sp.]|nr:LysM peptidoglycan-binding domain-containing protein [Treponema sp.]